MWFGSAFEPLTVTDWRNFTDYCQSLKSVVILENLWFGSAFEPLTVTDWRDLQFVEFQDGFLMKPVSQAVKAGGISGVRNYWLRHACPFSPWPGFMEVTIMHRQ